MSGWAIVSEPPSVSSPQRPELLADLVASSDDGDRPSITNVDGTVAKFEMAYSPDASDRFAFGPPTSARIPGYLFLLFAGALATAVVTAYYQVPHNSSLYIWVVEGDHHRVFGSSPLAAIILIAAIGNVIKTGLRGVIVTASGVESRGLIAGGLPKVQRWMWTQIDRVVIDGESVLLELWNGEYERLPKVKDGRKLANLIASVATARGRTVTRLNGG
jgi:hypothetical protein